VYALCGTLSSCPTKFEKARWLLKEMQNKKNVGTKCNHRVFSDWINAFAVEVNEAQILIQDIKKIIEKSERKSKK
jgi:hypothetical protein